MLEAHDVESVDISLDVCKKDEARGGSCTCFEFSNSRTRREHRRRDPLWTLWILLYHLENPSSGTLLGKNAYDLSSDCKSIAFCFSTSFACEFVLTFFLPSHE